MKILFVNNFFGDYGGTETVMYEQALKLKEMGHEVFFFATDRKPFFEKSYKYSLHFPKFFDYRSKKAYKNIFNLMRPFYNNESRKKLNSLIKRVNPDIIHCHNVYFHLTPSVFKACKDNHVPVVMTLNDIRLMCPAGTLLIEGKSYCREELCITQTNPFYCAIHMCKNKSIIQSLVVSLEFFFVKYFNPYNSVFKFICPSKAILELADRAGLDKNKLYLLNNFVPSFCNENNENIDPKQDYFFFVGRLSSEKGIQMLIKTFEMLPDIPLRIAGTGPEEVKLKIYCKQKDIKNITFLGSLDKEDLKEQYKGCIAVVLPSLWFETFGMSILESFAYGKPVIGNDKGAIGELIEDGVTGLLLNPCAIEFWVKAVNNLWNNKKLAKEMGVNAKEKAANYSSQEHVDELLRIYESAIKRNQYKKHCSD